MAGFQINKVYSILKKEVLNFKVPVVDLIEMQTHDPFKVLVTTMLSARTKDETTLEAARRLFEKVKAPEDFKNLSLGEIQSLIYPVGFYKNKARFLRNLPLTLENEFAGMIPQTIEELIKIGGVGRKTANLVVSVAFRKPGMCVDTHVHRIMNRLGYVRTKNPHETEMALRKKLPLKYWENINSMLVAFGQNTCRPISPWCSRCPIRKYCLRSEVKKSR
ncbi:endonuclease III [Candidatus Woesearchaeota archaeon]|nr:endonuclease III [Candidatus Woesearchaeota archaeon]